MLTRSQLIKLFSKHDFRPLKRLGAHYLIDGNIKDKIIGAVHPEKGDVILEIGPGLGALTIDLTQSGADVYAVEKDRKAFRLLSDAAKKDHPNLALFCGDILKFDLRQIPSGIKIKAVGNLPYYITTPIIEYLIEHKAKIGSAVLTVQKELAHRLLAQPGAKDYGSISCFVRYHAKPSYIYTIKRTSFHPPPRVDSSLIRLDFLGAPPVTVRDEKIFFKVIRAAFNQRRKSIINSVSRAEAFGIPKERLAELLKAAGVDPASRPESLGLSDFAAIADVL